MKVITKYYKNYNVFILHKEIERLMDNCKSEEITSTLDSAAISAFENNCLCYDDIFTVERNGILSLYKENIVVNKDSCYKWLEDNIEDVVQINFELLFKFWKEYPEGCINILSV